MSILMIGSTLCSCGFFPNEYEEKYGTIEGLLSQATNTGFNYVTTDKYKLEPSCLTYYDSESKMFFSLLQSNAKSISGKEVEENAFYLKYNIPFENKAFIKVYFNGYGEIHVEPKNGSKTFSTYFHIYSKKKAADLYYLATEICESYL